MKKAFFDTPQINWFPDGKRLNLRHGPIDLILEAETFNAEDLDLVYANAAAAFKSVLNTLAGELDYLRSPLNQNDNYPEGEIARAMVSASRPFCADHFLTPMICVAGSVADHILSVMCTSADLKKAYVNNGGDIAMYLSEGTYYDVGVCANPHNGEIVSKAHITSRDRVCGVATSGWRGRSHSFGIADSVTVLAANAAIADTAATLICNAVDLPGSPMVQRQPADTLSPDSDLGDRMVTTNVFALSETEQESALQPGKALAEQMLDSGLIVSAYLSLQETTQIIGAPHIRQSTPQPSMKNQISATGAMHA